MILGSTVFPNPANTLGGIVTKLQILWFSTTSFGKSTTYQYRGAPSTAATLSAQALATNDALSLGTAVAPIFGGYTQLSSTSGLWSVTVTIGEYYRK